MARPGQRRDTSARAGSRYDLARIWGEWMIMRAWLSTALLSCISAAGCSQAPQGSAIDATRHQPTAGRGTNPLTTVGHLAGIEAAGLTGDQRAMRGHVEAMHKNLMRDMRLADSGRPVNPEAARAALRPLKGVQSSSWIDRSNLLVLVGGGQYRSTDTIDRICGALEPLGDTLAVVVNVQDVFATTSEGADTLSRNCQLRAGERAMFQQKRQVDVLDPEVRRVFQRQQGLGK